MTGIQVEPRRTLPQRQLSFSIRTSALVCILATAMVFIGLLGLTSYTYRYALEQREQVSDWHLAQLGAAEDLRFMYLKYTQTWKDILLRGHDPQNYHSQLSAFYAIERGIQSGIEDLARDLSPDSHSSEALHALEQEFIQAGSLYRRALRKFNEDISDPQFAADAIIVNARIDPVQRNTEFIEALEASRTKSYQKITREMQVFERTMALIVLLIVCAFLLAVYFLSNLFIISPIKRGTSLAEKISRGDLENHVEAEQAASEINQLLQSLNRMQTNISHAHQELVTAKEQAERSNEAKTAFLSRMSHELRTPLHAILGFGQILLLQSDPLSEHQQNSVEKILKAGQHLLDLINEVLDLARIDNNKLEITIGNVELSEIIAECIELTMPLAQDKNTRIINQIPTGQHYVVRADEQRLKQAFINLISNAIKYGFEHGTVTLQCEKTADCNLCIKISDNGPGIPVEKQHLLFKPFERLNTQQFVEGTGIGLALTKKLIELMNGKAGMESEPGKGSTFWVQLQLATSDYPHHHIEGNATDRFNARQAQKKHR